MSQHIQATANLPAAAGALTDRTQPWPHWLTVAVTSLDERNLRRPRISSDVAPTDEQRTNIQARLSSLGASMAAGPWERSARAVGVLMATYPVTGGDDAVRARVQAFRIALDDLPAWSVEQAVKAWLRGEVDGKSNVAFLPAPPQLRDLAKRALAPVKGEARKLRSLLAAEVFEPLQLSRAECDRRAADLQGLIRKAAHSSRATG